MKNNKYMATCARLTTVLLVIFTTGCMSFSDRHFRPVKDSLAQQMPDIRLDKEIAFSASSGLINLIDILGGNEVDLDDLNRVRIAVYKVVPANQSKRFNDVVFEMALLATNSELTWERIVRVREETEQLWIFAGLHEAEQRLEVLSIFTLERDELVLINVDGDLGSLLQHAMAPVRGRRGVYRAG
ncbi:MAG: hypothetical protein RKH07_16415 [Gammaproteobacteria bacterium]